MKVLVTGSTGFVGRYLIPRLIEAGHTVAEVTVQPEISYEFYGNSTIKIIVGDSQIDFVDNVCSFSPDIVIHLASYLSSADDFQTVDKILGVNIKFFCRLLDSVKDCDVKLFINTGSSTEYLLENGLLYPAYFYSASKTAARYFLKYFSHAYSFNYLNVIPYTIYGRNDSQGKIIDIIIKSLTSSNAIDLSPGEQVLDFIHVEDVAEFYVHIVDKYQTISTENDFQLGTGKGTSLKQLANIIEDVTGKKAAINWGGKPYRKTDILYSVANTETYSSLINWHPKITIHEGIKGLLSICTGHKY